MRVGRLGLDAEELEVAFLPRWTLAVEIVERASVSGAGHPRRHLVFKILHREGWGRQIAQIELWCRRVKVLGAAKNQTENHEQPVHCGFPQWVGCELLKIEQVKSVS